MGSAHYMTGVRLSLTCMTRNERGMYLIPRFLLARRGAFRNAQSTYLSIYLRNDSSVLRNHFLPSVHKNTASFGEIL